MKSVWRKLGEFGEVNYNSFMIYLFFGFEFDIEMVELRDVSGVIVLEF